jgi:hypothetical protein
MKASCEDDGTYCVGLDLTGGVLCNSVYASFLDELEQRIKQGDDPKCFARDMSALADKHGFDAAQKYFCGEFSFYRWQIPFFGSHVCSFKGIALW